MKLYRGINHIPSFPLGSVLTIGNFDGVHLGHQLLLSRLKQEALHRKLPMVVMLFEPQPNEFFKKNQAPYRLASFREKLLMLAKCEVDYVICLTFNKQLATLEPEIFATRYFFSILNARYLLVGKDFRFGFNRRGEITLLDSLASHNNCELAVFNDYFIHGNRVSSTLIRERLSQGQFDEAKKLLGRDYSLCGKVTRGEGRGKQWGFPTANLHLRRPSLPIGGVFIVRITWRQKRYEGVANIGKRPTVAGIKNRLEVYLFNFSESLYGELLEVCFLKKLRDEIKFESIDVLLAQIRQDVHMAKNYFANSH